MNRSQLARELGLSRSYISKQLLGERPVLPEVREALAREAAETRATATAAAGVRVRAALVEGVVDGLLRARGG